MIKKNLAVMCLSISILMLACSGTAKEKKFSILSGTVSSLQMDKLYLIDLTQPKAGPIDTAVVDENGKFAFDYLPKMKGFYRITLNDQYAIILPLSADEQVRMIGDGNQLKDLQISGSIDAERMAEFNTFMQMSGAKAQALEAEFQQFANSPKKDSILIAFRNRYGSIEAERIKKMKTMIDEDPSLFSNLALIEQLPKEGEDNIKYYKKVDEALATKYASSPYYNNFHAQLKKMTLFAKGSDVPEINLPSPSGENVALSSLRGKVVLIDFWASWCRPCRMENPNVVAAYNKFKDKGFTVYGVSLDRTKDAWVNAIAQDNLTWTHVSDLKFWNSEAAKAYGVSGIPFAVLIDAEGKVIGKNLRGPALHQKLEEVLN